MATVTATLSAGAGYDNITLTSWAGDASFSPAPVAGGQIEHVDTISVDATGVVTGADGTYTLLYISPTGAAQAIEYLIGEPAESATVSAVLSSGAGWDYVTLTSWSGDAAFSTTPVAGGQIEGSDALTLNTDGTVSGADGSYPLLYIAPDGQFEGITYTIGTSDVTGPIIDTLTATGTDPDSIAVSFNSNEDNGTSYFFATAAATTETASAIKAGAQGSQAVTATGAQSLTLTLATGTWYIHVLHEDAAGNPSNILVSDAVTLAEIVESATTTAVFSGGADYTTATLGAGFDASTSAFQQWTGGEPAAGWQIETLTAGGWFDEDGQYWKPAGVADGIQDVWVIRPDGTVTVEQFDNTGLATIDATEAPQGTWTIGTITTGETTASLTPVYSLAEADSFQYSINSGAWITFTGTISLSALDADTTYSGALRATNSTGSGATELFSFTTDAIPVTPDPPTLATALPDLNLSEGNAVSINLNSYFVGAVSYGAIGLPAGLTLSGSVISGTAQVGSATVTVTATNTDGSVSDAFGLTVTAIEEAGPIEVQREYSIDAGLSGLPKSQAFIFYQGDRVQITIVHDFDLSDKVLRYRQAEKVGLPARLKLDFSDNVIVFTTEETGLMTASTKVWQVILRQGDSTVVVAEGKITVKPRIKDE